MVGITVSFAGVILVAIAAVAPCRFGVSGDRA